ncbi:hypothetical protein [Moorena producens]|uniref:hypothetical protein n=1 Tax=Moorena producens TaxID=1155739 RepID=UPI003C77BE82
MVHRIFPHSTTPCSLFPVPDSRFPIPDSRLPIPDSLFPVPYSQTCYKSFQKML